MSIASAYDVMLNDLRVSYDNGPCARGQVQCPVSL